MPQLVEAWLKDGAAIAELFVDLPEAIANTRVIAEMCGGTANPNNKPKPIIMTFELKRQTD